MRSERNEDLCLRIGVRQGGCSGMSYTMEFESRANARPDDSIIEYNGFVIGKSYGFAIFHLEFLVRFLLVIVQLFEAILFLNPLLYIHVYVCGWVGEGGVRIVESPSLVLNMC